MIRKQAIAIGENRLGGFTLVKTCVAVSLSAVMIGVLYFCFVSGWVIQQNLLQRLEGVRLCSFDQITILAYHPGTSTELHNPAARSKAAGGRVYNITSARSIPPVGTVPGSYRTNMRQVSVTAVRKSGAFQRLRSTETFAARSGTQGYVVADR